MFSFILILNSSFASTSKISDLAVIDSIKENVTTKDDILQLLGKPESINDNNYNYDGPVEVWSYSYSESRSNSAESLKGEFIDGVGDELAYRIWSSIGGSYIGEGASSVTRHVIGSKTNKHSNKSLSRYSLSIHFKDDIVVKKNYSSSGGNAVDAKLKGAKTKTYSKHETRATGNNPVYTSLTSQVFHKKSCSKIADVEVISFNSRKEVLRAGGSACGECNP